MKPTVRDIVRAASFVSGFTANEITGQRRFAPLVRIRQAVCLVAREQGYSYPQIARTMDRDHTTIMHGCDRAEAFAERDPAYVAKISAIRRLSRPTVRVSVTYDLGLAA